MTLSRARLSAQFYLTRVRSEVNELKSQQFPGDHPGPQLWLRLTTGILDTAASYLDLSSQAGTSPDNAKTLIRDASDLAHLAYRCLQLMSGASTDSLPYPIVPPLQRWFDLLRLPNSTFFRSEHVANYELRRIERNDFDRLRNKASSLSDAISSIKWPILRVTVPSKALGIIPHFSIVAHEVGHALFHSIQWDWSGHANDVTSLYTRIAARLSVAAIDTETDQILKKAQISWIEEIASDAFAFLVTGPAFFFALSDFFQLLSPGYGLGSSHPPNDLRRSIVFNRMKSGADPTYISIFRSDVGEELTEEFNSTILKTRPSTGDLFNELKPKIGDKQAAVLAELCIFLDALAPTIYTQAETHLRQHFPSILYTPSQYQADIRGHLSEMLVAIPPIESGKKLDEKAPTSFATVLNIGWIALLTKLADLQVKYDPSQDRDAQRAESLHSLLLKAVELSEARRIWDGA